MPFGKRRNFMAVASYSPGIETISGSLARPKKVDGHNHGDYLFGTHRVAPTTNPNCCRLYIRKADSYKRTTPLTQDEIGARNRFKTVSQMIKARKQDLNKITQDQEAFLAQKNLPNGLKTMKKWYWSVVGEEYDNQ